MSGICAVLGPNADRLAERICKSLQHRGPDAEGLFFDKNLALGHRELKINGSSVSHQPLANEDETVWITFDGEIYNKRQLIQKLSKNHIFHTNSSAEVMVHCYEDYGFTCLSKINGMFAFCLWDSNNAWIFSARDRLGMKPLYYYSFQDQFALASEIKGILSNSSVPREPNKRLIYEYLVTGYPSKVGDTFFTGIKELMPGHYMVIDKSLLLEIRKYWQPTQNLKSNHLIMDDKSCASRFLHLLQDSISIRLPTNLPVGIFLSGGLDSTTIAFLVKDILKSRNSHNEKAAKLQEIFSAIYDEPTEQGDERQYIKIAEEALKTEINYIFPSVMGEWNNIKKFVLTIEEPVAVFNYYIFWCLFQAAKNKDKIIFSGQGADAILGGQTKHALIYYKELWKNKKIRKLLNELVKSLDWISPMLVWSIIFDRKAKSKAKALLAPKFVMANNQDETPKTEDSLQNTLVRDVTEHAIEYLRVDDRLSSAFSVECRHPFLDHRIVEFAFALPATQKICDGWTKYVMRNAVKGLIPESIRIKRKKSGTPIPQQRWMRELQNIRKLFASKKFFKRGYYNQLAILDVFDRYCEGKLSRIEREYYQNILWRILNLELWLETFFDKK